MTDSPPSFRVPIWARIAIGTLAVGLIGATIWGIVLSATWRVGADGPDWSQFIPDLLSGGIVTLLVGAAVAYGVHRLEVRANAQAETVRQEATDRANEQAALLGWRRPKAKLIGGHIPPSLGGRTETLPNFTRSLDDWLRPYQELPIEEWAAAAPKEASLQNVAELLSLAPALNDAASRLYDAIGVAYGNLFSDTNRAARMRDITQRQLLGLDLRELSQEDQALHDEMLTNPPFAEKLSTWIELRDRAQVAYSAVLALKDRQPRTE